MRMKFNKSGQLLLVSAASLLVAVLLTACGATNTVDFVYVTSAQAAGTNSYGEVDVFEVNLRSGFMRQIPTSPFPSGGRNPVADAVSSDYQNLYVVNQDDNTIVQFAIGTDGKLYPQNTVNTPGIYPLAIAVSGSNLFVLDTYQPLNTCSNTAPCSGSIAAYPVGAASGSTPSGTLGAPLVNGNLNYWPLNLPGNSSNVVQPTGISVLASGAYLYVSAYDTTANTGYVFAFSVGSDGTLTALNGGAPVAAGIHPSAIASDPSSSYVYLTDATAGKVLGYSVQPTGLLAPMTSGTGGGNTFPAGTQPSAVVVDPSGSFLYVTNFLDATVTAYSINAGALTRVGSFATGLQPIALGIEPALHKYLYTINFLGSSVSAFQMNPTDGTLINAQGTPYHSNPLPTAVAAIPHGSALTNLTK
jgi:6-phosphogluconolactonase (cycloisomerase 2 family)